MNKKISAGGHLNSTQPKQHPLLLSQSGFSQQSEPATSVSGVCENPNKPHSVCTDGNSSLLLVAASYQGESWDCTGGQCHLTQAPVLLWTRVQPCHGLINCVLPSSLGVSLPETLVMTWHLNSWYWAVSRERFQSDGNDPALTHSCVLLW